MKRTPKPYTREFMPIVIWRDDLERLIEILARQGGSVEIVFGDYTFNHLEEFAAHFGKRRETTNVEVKGSKPYASIDLTRVSNRLYVSSSDEHGAGIFHEASMLLAACQRHWPLLYSWPFIWSVQTLNNLPLIGRLLFGINVPISGQLGTYLNVWILFWTGWLFWAMFIRMRRSAVVMLVRRNDALSFWERNKDRIILAIISGLVGAGLAAVTPKISSYLWPADQKNISPNSP